MIATCEQPTPLDQWRKRLGGRRRSTQPRPLAALGYLTNGPVIDGLIEVENLGIVILHDARLRSGYCALRLAGYSGSRVPWGVRFGGSDNRPFVKDLRLQPMPGARGYRLDVASEELLVLGLQLDRQLDRCARYHQRQVRQHPLLPKLWAGFQEADAPGLTGEGPEIEAYAARTGRSPRNLLRRLRRDHLGLVLYPLAWVSHHWRQAAAIFAGLEGFPRRQVFRLRRMPHDLTGFQGAAEIDFRSISYVRAPKERQASTS